MAIVPPSEQKNRYALTANPLFSDEIVFSNIVIAGAIQFSALRYSKASIQRAKANPGVV